jgi:hypothetical protein
MVMFRPVNAESHTDWLLFKNFKVSPLPGRPFGIQLVASLQRVEVAPEKIQGSHSVR